MNKLEAMAVNVPIGISLDGLWRSLLILMPANTPVTAGKNTPTTVKIFVLEALPS